MMILNLKVYGYNKFIINDGSTLDGVKEVFLLNKTNSTSSKSKRSLNHDDPCDIIEIWYNPDGDACNCNGDEYDTGDRVYADPERCFDNTLPVVWYLFGGAGDGGYDFPINYYPIPDLPGGGGGGSSNPPFVPVIPQAEKINYLTDQLFINQTQLSSLVNIPDAVNTLFSYLYGQYTIARRNVAIWAVDYLVEHPDVNMQKFENQFLGDLADSDGSFDQEFWDDPNNIFPPQDLPTWATFKANFPSHDDPLYDNPTKMFTQIGGAVYTNGYTGILSNTCAIRLSKALNYSKTLADLNITIPNIPTQTFKGDDGKYYFLGAANMIAWMKQTFGTSNSNYHSYSNADGGSNGLDYREKVGIKKGIYGMLPINHKGCDGTGFCATGHVDLINKAICDGECYFSATGGVYQIVIWTLN